MNRCGSPANTLASAPPPPQPDWWRALGKVHCWLLIGRSRVSIHKRGGAKISWCVLSGEREGERESGGLEENQINTNNRK